MIKIIVDSCCDLPEDLQHQAKISSIPLHITVGGQTYRDDGSLDTGKLITEMRRSPNPPVTACPSPGDFAQAMSGEDDTFVVTMSNHVSGTYQSAMTGAMVKSGNGRVHVFNSKSASAGQALIVHNLLKSIKAGVGYEDIVSKTEEFIANMRTFFVLESLDNLIKNGRMNRLVGQVASILNMRPIMGADDGKIVLVEKARGTLNAMSKLADHILRGPAAGREVLVIAHCNCLDRAQRLKDDLLSKGGQLKDIIIVKTGGLSTTYANDGGIIVAN